MRCVEELWLGKVDCTLYLFLCKTSSCISLFLRLHPAWSSPCLRLLVSDWCKFGSGSSLSPSHTFYCSQTIWTIYHSPHQLKQYALQVSLSHLASHLSPICVIKTVNVKPKWGSLAAQHLNDWSLSTWFPNRTQIRCCIKKQLPHSHCPALCNFFQSLLLPTCNGSTLIFNMSELWKPGSPYCVMLYFSCGCWENFKLITLGSERVNACYLDSLGCCTSPLEPCLPTRSNPHHQIGAVGLCTFVSSCASRSHRSWSTGPILPNRWNRRQLKKKSRKKKQQTDKYQFPVF